ncbi:MAG: peptidase, partial [Nitrosomonas sp.]|nr:peptidase [Nitrosomonas sp.]
MLVFLLWVVVAKAVAEELRSRSTVETAYVEGGTTPPPLNPSDDPRSTNQGYLDAAPGGIDARAIWTTADGSGIGFVDLEQGWTLNHEDLAAANISI